LLVPSGTLSDPSRHHLFVLVTNACNANFHLAISISSIKSGISHDPTCIIEKDEHPFVDLRSYVVYARPQQLLRPNIVRCADGRIYTPKEDCNAAVLQRICDGVMESSFTPRWAKSYFATNRKR
jgi:hypothetical protein